MYINGGKVKAIAVVVCARREEVDMVSSFWVLHFRQTSLKQVIFIGNFNSNKY